MTAATQQHPASVALQSLMVAIHEAPLSEDHLTEVARYIAAIVGNNDDLRAACTELAREKVELERAVAAMEKLDTKRVLKIGALKRQLGDAQQELERFHAELADVGGRLAVLQRRSDTLRQLTTPFEEPAPPAGVAP